MESQLMKVRSLASKTFGSTRETLHNASVIAGTRERGLTVNLPALEK